MAPRPELSREMIVERALALADAEGLEAVTVRRLGQELGVTAMALYWHVKNKDELLDAMGDRMFETVEYRVADDAAWDVKLHAIVHGLAQAFRRHPGSLDLAYRRVFESVEGLALSEYALGMLGDAGFTDRQTADIATHALHTALMLVHSEPGLEGGQEEAAEKLAAKREMVRQLPADRFPNIQRLVDEMLQCDDVDGYYAFNTDLFVAGARAMLAANPAPTRRRAPARRPARKTAARAR